jgi:hypothetical protein
MLNLKEQIFGEDELLGVGGIENAGGTKQKPKKQMLKATISSVRDINDAHTNNEKGNLLSCMLSNCHDDVYAH